MCSHGNSYYIITKFIITIWKYSGLPVYRLEGKNMSQTKKIVYETSHPFILGFLLIFIATSYIKYVGIEREMTSYVLLLFFGSIYMQIVGIVFIFHVKRQAIATILTKLLIYEEKLLKFCKSRSTSNKIKTKFFVYAFFQVIILIATIIMDYDSFTRNLVDVLPILTQYFELFFYFNFDFLLAFLVFSIDDLYSKLIFSTKINHTNWKENLQMFRNLHSLCNNVNSTLQELVLLKMLADFTLAVSTVFYAIYELQEINETDLFTVMLPSIIYYSLWVIRIFISNFTICWKFHTIAQKVNKCDILMYYKFIDFYVAGNSICRYLSRKLSVFEML
jgi:hypothetical protein